MLYLVATPIGNLGDFSPRARTVLEQADIVACEDTRTSRQLFSLLGISVKKTMAYHDFNEEKVVPDLIQKLSDGVNIALISDAGMPLVSDPGYKLVRACREHHIDVTSVPGPNAVLTALQLSGLPSHDFYFGGFLPHKSTDRKAILKRVESWPTTLIFYETPHRLISALQDILNVLGNREMSVVREITKKFEETKFDTVANLLNFYQNQGAPKGELVLVVGGAKVSTKAPQSNVSISDLRAFLSAKDTASVLSLLNGISKKEAYAQVLASDKL